VLLVTLSVALTDFAAVVHRRYEADAPTLEVGEEADTR
jgi:hypothetical protein